MNWNQASHHRNGGTDASDKGFDTRSTLLMAALKRQNLTFIELPPVEVVASEVRSLRFASWPRDFVLEKPKQILSQDWRHGMERQGEAEFLRCVRHFKLFPPRCATLSHFDSGQKRPR